MANRKSVIKDKFNEKRKIKMTETRKVYDAYNRPDLLSFEEVTSKLKTIKVAMFKLANAGYAQTDFLKILHLLIKINKASQENQLFCWETTLEPDNSNGWAVLKINNRITCRNELLPDVIYQDVGNASEIVLCNHEKIKNADEATKCYIQATENNVKCMSCGRTIKNNSFLYYKDGAFYGKTCYERKFANEKQILRAIAILNFATQIIQTITHLNTEENSKNQNVIGYTDNDLDKQYLGDNLGNLAYQLLINNGYVQNDFSKDEMKNVAKVVIEKMFLVNFITISHKIKVTPELQKQFLNTHSFKINQLYEGNNTNVDLYKLSSVDYIKRMQIAPNRNLTLFYNTYDLISKMDFNKGANDLQQLESLLVDLKNANKDDNLQNYLNVLGKIAPLIDKGYRAKPTQDVKTLPLWYIDTRLTKENAQKGYQVKQDFDFGEKHLYLIVKKQ